MLLRPQRSAGADGEEASTRQLRSADTPARGAAVPSTAHQVVDIVPTMTTRWERRAVRLAWGIGLCSLGLVIASLVLLALDWKAIDSPFTAQFTYFLAAPITGILGVLIATRRPRNPIGWLLLAIAAADAIYLTADFIGMRGLLSGASPKGWVTWVAWVYASTALPGTILIAFVILPFSMRNVPSRVRPV